jgi:deazaflavin-dependent oxidoreductase (nitroreductase family)
VVESKATDIAGHHGDGAPPENAAASAIAQLRALEAWQPSSSSVRDVTLRYVDPRARRSLLYRAYARLTGTRVMGWISRKVAWKVDPHLLRLTGGRFGFGLILPTALLETRGARTGRVRRNGVIYFHDGDRVTIVASKLGLPEHPAWFHNARANPDVVFGGRPFRAEVVTDEVSRARLWELADRVFPSYAAYRERAARAGRTIPILQLVPR